MLSSFDEVPAGFRFGPLAVHRVIKLLHSGKAKKQCVKFHTGA